MSLQGIAGASAMFLSNTDLCSMKVFLLVEFLLPPFDGSSLSDGCMYGLLVSALHLRYVSNAVHLRLHYAIYQIVLHSTLEVLAPLTTSNACQLSMETRQ